MRNHGIIYKNRAIGREKGYKMAEKIIMTKQGYEEAVKRLDYLTKVKRAEIIGRIQEARSHGDLSENAEYDAARNEQTANESEIGELEYQIKNAVVAHEAGDTSEVRVGLKITVRRGKKVGDKFVPDDPNETEQYAIRGTTEVKITDEEIIISNESPVGKALLGHREGDVVYVKAPHGESYLEIVKIDN